MKRLVLILSLSLFSMASFSQSESVINLTDISYVFDQKKVDASEDSFHFLRSFVPYYYGLIDKNSSALNITTKTKKTPGWCAGDAHAENFGILIQENLSQKFTINDLDDSGPCPVTYELLRMLVSSKLYDPSLNIDALINAYKIGFSGQLLNVPSIINSLSETARTKGTGVNPKKIEGRKLKRNSETREVNPNLQILIQSLLESAYRSEELKLLDVVATSKISGGSGGLQRYEILVTNKKNVLILLELKELTEPAIVVVKTSEIPRQDLRIKTSLSITQGQNFSHYYNVFDLEDKTMLLRPKFFGNQGINLKDFSTKENRDLMEYDTYILGKIHAQSVNSLSYLADLENMKMSDWESDVNSLTHFFIKKYDSLRR